MKYLFTVYFQDGTFYEQNEQDVSRSSPERSCFFDIQQQENAGNPVVIFCLTNGINSYLVDLRDGHFEVNGVHLDLNDEEVKGPFRLIYFRRHTHNFSQGGGQDAHWFTYNMGWQATHNGENVKRIIRVLD